LHRGPEVAYMFFVMKLCGALFLIVLTAAVSALSEERAVSAVSSAAWDVLDKGLSDSSSDHRRQAILAVGTIGATPQTLKIIEAGLQDKDPLVRQTAAAELGRLKAPESIPYLQQALQDENEVSFTAAKALWDIGDTSGRTLLEEVLTGDRSDKPGFLQSKWREGKQKLHHPAQLALMGVNEAAGNLFGPASMGITAAEEAIKNVEGSKKDALPGRSIAALSLAEHPDDQTRSLLEWALTDKNSTVRAAAAKALGECGNSETVAKLQPLLKDGQPAVRLMAAASIVRLTKTQPSPAAALR
jgi:HEAT repeat protein